MAFVTNANDDVTAGSDGVEHMQVIIYYFLLLFNFGCPVQYSLASITWLRKLSSLIYTEISTHSFQ